MPNPKRPKPASEASNYAHPAADLALRPEVGTQAQFKKHKAPQTYRYDSSLSPALEWDGQNPAREEGERCIVALSECAARIAETAQRPPSAQRDADLAALVSEIHALQARLQGLSRPFLNWTGKAERLSFDVPTLPLFVHERLSTRAIIETLTGHRKDQNLDFLANLFADPRHSVSDQVLRAYEYREGWVNRLILGDSLAVMNSLLRFESLGGQVQMIYMDPPYGVKFGSNFQPFVRKRDVSHGDDADMTREPEMVQAYRDTWELGLHSYLTYLRDRLTLARHLLSPSGSIFVQISDENLHHVREIMDEVFGGENFLVTIFLRKKGSQRGNEIRPINDHLIWYCKDKSRVKRRFIYDSKLDSSDLADEFEHVELPTGETKRTSSFTLEDLESAMTQGARLYVPEPLTSGGEFRTQLYPVEFQGQTFRPPPNNSWKFSEEGMKRIIALGRLHVGKNQIRFRKYHTDFPFRSISNLWSDMAGASDKLYVVQTATKAIQRCLLMTTDPGDLVMDPTCGSGTTAYVAEQWGRRWITCDTSRVPLALARQRLLTATFGWYDLKDEGQGPAGGFTYRRRQNARGEEVGGIVPHVTSSTIANNELPAEEVLVDRPEEKKGVTRVCGPFVVEATIPTAHGLDTEPETPGLQGEGHGAFTARMIEVLRKSPVLRLDGNRTMTFRNIRPPARTLVLGAEALQVDGEERPVAFVFGPEGGAVSERLVSEAAREAWGKSYARLYVIGFAIEAKARETVENCEAVFNVPATYVQATPDLLMGDLLKNMRSSQIFSVCGLPEITVRRVKGGAAEGRAAKGGSKGDARRDAKEGDGLWQVELLGLDVCDPVTMEVAHRAGLDVPAWFLDADYNGRVFHVTQAFFPKTGAWESLKKALKGDYDETVWDHLAGTVSAPFAAGEHREVAVKVIDDRGNELLVVRKLEGTA